MPTVTNVDALFEGVRAGDRVRIGQALTLVESTRPDHQQAATMLLGRLLPYTGAGRRVGLSGTPGVGKSTFVDAYGARLADSGEKVAVLAIDPSSAQTGGSLLGDKTRMEKLAAHPQAFVRPSPTRGVLGGVAAATREAIGIVEAAGYSNVFVETVGVGQSETLVSTLVDCFVLLVQPGGGDEVQGLKRGIMEHADVLVVHKADQDAARTREAVRAYRSALHLFPARPDGWTPLVVAVSSLTGAGLDRFDEALDSFFASEREVWRQQRRQRQRLEGFRQRVEQALVQRFYADPAVSRTLPDIEQQVLEGTADVRTAAQALLDGYTDASTRPPR